MFHIGQLVVCVRDDWDNDRGESMPKKGRIYTVRDLVPFSDGDALLLSEIVNAPREYREGFGEKCFNVHAFRPLDSSRISIFTRMLETEPLTPSVTA